MKKFYEAMYISNETGKVLKRFSYPANKIQNKYFWEKLKQEELIKLTKSRLLEQKDVTIVDTSEPLPPK